MLHCHIIVLHFIELLYVIYYLYNDIYQCVMF